MKKSNLIVFFSIFTICLLGIFSIILTNNKEASKKADNIVKEIKNSTGYQLLYVYTDECEPCNYEESQIELLINNYDFGLYHLNLKSLSEKKISETLISIGIKEGTFSTPSLIVFKDGKYIDILSGLAPVNEIFDFLQKNSIINDEEELLLKYLDLDSYFNIIESNDAQVIALGNVALDESNYVQSQLWELASKNEIKINYMFLTSLNQEEGRKFENSLDYFNTNEVGLPMLLIVKNKEVISSTLEVLEMEGYINFLKENGIL